MNRLALVLGLAFGLPISLCSAQNDQNPVEKTGKTIEHGAAATGRTIKHGAEATARTVGKGVSKTGQTLEHVGHGTSSTHATHHRQATKQETTGAAKATPAESKSAPTPSPSPMAAPGGQPSPTPAQPEMTPNALKPTPTPGG